MRASITAIFYTLGFAIQEVAINLATIRPGIVVTNGHQCPNPRGALINNGDTDTCPSQKARYFFPDREGASAGPAPDRHTVITF